MSSGQFRDMRGNRTVLNPCDESVLDECRSRIDAVDKQILALLEQRNQVVNDVIEAKVLRKLPIYVAKREATKISAFRTAAEQYGLDPEWAEDFLRMIMGASRAMQSSSRFPSATVDPMTILIVGGNGAMGRCYGRMVEGSGHALRILEREDWTRVSELCDGVDAVIVSVPIHRTREVIQTIAPHLPSKAVLADFTSTKNGLLNQMLALHAGSVVGLHPMHGPDVANLSKQLMMVLPGRGVDQAHWLIRQFELWGMRTKFVDPVKHDHAMHMIQGLRHFVALLHGSFMRAYDLRPEDILDFSSPVYRAELMMMGRIFAQDAELYGDIVFSDEERRMVLKRFLDHHVKIQRLVELNDKKGFIKEFKAIRAFFGEFAEQALKESGYLINHLSDRFA